MIMLAQAVGYLDSKTEEPIIGLEQWMMSPETMIQHFNMGYSFTDIMKESRLLLRDEEATVHSLAGELNTAIELYDVGANETVAFQPSRATPSRTRWIIRYSNGMCGRHWRERQRGQRLRYQLIEAERRYNGSRRGQARRKALGTIHRTLHRGH